MMQLWNQLEVDLVMTFLKLFKPSKVMTILQLFLVRERSTSGYAFLTLVNTSKTYEILLSHTTKARWERFVHTSAGWVCKMYSHVVVST